MARPTFTPERVENPESTQGRMGRIQTDDFCFKLYSPPRLPILGALQGGLPSKPFEFPCFIILDLKGSGKQVLAASVDTDDDLNPSVSSVTSASSPSPHRAAVRSIPRDDSLLSAPWASLSTSPAAVSSLSTSDSPSRLDALRSQSVTPNPSNLPSLSRYRGTEESVNESSPENRRPESSVYYTTAWGSPYAAPSPRTLSLSLSQHAGVDRGSGDSSPVSMRSGVFQGIESSNNYDNDNDNDNENNHHRQNNTISSKSSENEQLRPSGGEGSARNLYSGILNRSPGRDIPGKKGGKSIKDFTQDWINQYLSGQSRSERSNWLSDDSGSEAPSFFTAQNHYADDDWLGLEDDSRDEDILRTPTVADFASRKKGIDQSENSSSNPARRKLRDYFHKRTETLKQEDFWGFAYDKDPRPIAMENTDSLPPTEPEASQVTSPVEKPLPTPPQEQGNDGVGNEASQPEPAENNTPQPPEPKPTLARTPTATLQRNRKKIPWKGKACIIALPLEDNRGSEESGGYRLLSAQDVEDRLKKWEEEGHDVRGFRVSTPVDDPNDALAIELGGSSRPSFPDSSDLQEEYQAGRFGVRIPDRAEWERYVNFLQEEKLRALGVSLGEEENDGQPPSVSPASAAMSQMAPFPGLIASPPIPTASAASNPLAIPHPFSPQLNQSANSPNGIGSLASPASQFGVQTPFLGVDQHLLGGYHLPFQPTPPTHGSFTPQSFLNTHQAGALPGTLPNMTSMLSPVSPLNDQGAFQAALDHGPKDFNDQFQQGMSDDGTGAGGHQIPRAQTPTDGRDNFHASNVEIAQPTPRGHSRGQNLSETLQKGLDQFGHSDYHLERSIERQLDEDDHDAGGRDGFKSSGLLNSRWAMPDSAFNQHDGSDIDTNPSLSGVPHGHGPLANDIAWHESKPSHGSHQSKLSASTFNVEAKEFDPTGAFSPQNLPFQNNAFQFQDDDQSLFTFGAGQGFQSVVPPPTNPFNVTAPAFNPNDIDNHQKDAPSGEFKFSSASFNVEAPAFNPSGSVNSTSSVQPTGERTKIFGDIDFSEISKPAKKSKAIPIVRPDESDNKEKDKDNDADLASLQSVPTERNKRARREELSDGETELSVPTRALTETNNAQAPSQELMSHAQAEGKENAAPESEVDNAKPPAIIARKDTPVSEASTWTPPDAKDQQPGDAVVPGSPVRHEAPEAAVNKQPEAAQPPAEEVVPEVPAPRGAEQDDKSSEEEPEKNSFLSPAAKPFEFKPAVPEFMPPSAEKPSTAPEKPAKGLNSLMSSRYAAASPPSSPKDKPLPPEPPRPEPAQKDQPAEPKERQLDESDDGSTDEDDINAIMEQLNDDSDIGIERLNTPQPPTAKASGTVVAPSKEKRHVQADARSEAPSPSPGREPVSAVLEIPKLDFDAPSQASGTPSKSMAGAMRQPVRQLANENEHISDWDDVISSGEGEKFLNRSRFFDRRINDLVGSAVEERLSPLERALGLIQQSMTSIASGAQNKWALRSTSATGEDSDADDEDDEYPENSSIRARSPLNQKDRKLDKLKSVIQDALATRAPVQEAAPPAASNNEITQLRQSFVELQELTTQKLSSHDPTTNMKAVIQETIAAQMSLQNARPSSDADEIGADSLMLQIQGLKGMLRVADERSEQEYKIRRETQDAMAELQRLLKVAEEDAARHSAAAESAETRFLAFKEENIPRFEHVQSRSDGLSQERESLRLTLAEISSKNITLQGTLDEHRVSSDSWKRESEKYKTQLEESQAENKKLHESIERLRVRLEDGVNIRKNISDKFDRLQEEMANVTRDITRDQANWRWREEELRAAHSRESKLREKLEDDIRELEQQEREAAKLKFIFGQSQQENARLEELVGHLRLENHEAQNKAAKFEREFNEARESSRVEIQRTRTSLEGDIEASNSQVNIVRAELEGQIIRLQSQQDNIRLDADTARERYEMLIEEANEAKANAIASKELALDDQRRLHERSLNDLRERHARALHNSSEDKQRKESYMSDRLELSESKAQHLQDRVNHLEEKLEITKSAARAAAEAASKGGAVSPDTAAGLQAAAFSKGPEQQLPEKISPQALRESILVLQDQLQQREARIDELEQETSSVDKNAPNRIKEQDTEITWLRELLGVRIDDLQDIINTVSRPSFDQHAVRDAAIRLRANLQMQLQERERAQEGQGFPSLPSISEMAASPRALPMAAAAAWGSWRRTRDNTNPTPGDQTPSKSSNTGAFLSGLLTPPGSNARQSPRANAPIQPESRRTSESRPLKGFNPTPRPLSARQGNNNNANANANSNSTVPEPPKTPPLLRRSSYDHDAEPAEYDEHGQFEDGESVADEMVSASPKDSTVSPTTLMSGGVGGDPFGPQIPSASD